MAALTIQNIAAAGAVVSTTAAAGGGDTVQPPAGAADDRCFLQVTNGGGSSINVTIADPGFTPASNAGSPTVVAVAASATKLIALPPGAVNPANGLISISYSAVTSVTVAALRR